MKKHTTTKDIVLTDNAGVTTSLNADLIQKLRLAARAFSHPIRQSLLKLLDGTETDVTTIYRKKLKMEQSVCSQHLAILRREGLVKTRRDGKNIFYSISAEGLKTLRSASELFKS